MNKALAGFATKLGGVLLSALLGAISLFLSRVLEPVISWLTFTSLKFLIKTTKSDTLRSLYGDLKKGYNEQKGKE